MEFILKHFNKAYFVVACVIFFAFGYAVGNSFWTHDPVVEEIVVTPAPIEEGSAITASTEWLVSYFSVDQWATERAVEDGFDENTHYVDQLVGAASLCVEPEAEIAYVVDDFVKGQLVDEADNPLHIITLSLLYGKATEYGEGVSCLGLLPEILDEIQNSE